MDNHVYRSALLGAGIALLLTLIVGVCTGGASAEVQPQAAAAAAVEAPTPTLGPTVPETGVPAPVKAAP